MTREDLRSAAAAEVDRWEQALADELERLFDRQQAVVLARLQGTKARKHTRHWEPPGDRPLEVKMVLDPARWVQDAAGSLAPIIRRLFAAVYGRVSKGLAPDLPDAEHAPADTVVEPAIQARLGLVAQGVQNAADEVQKFIDSEDQAGSAMPDIAQGVRDLYKQRQPTWAARIAQLSAVGSINQAALLAATDRGSSAKQWLSRRDAKVRDTHKAADGQVRLLDEKFRLGGIPTHPQRSLLLFPGDPDPAVPLDEVINCRCTLLFSPPKRQAKAAWDVGVEVGSSVPGSAQLARELAEVLETKDRVRTPAGARHYGQPIGSTIHRDVAGVAPLTPTFQSPSATMRQRVTPTPGRVVGRVGGAPVDEAGADPSVRALVAKYSTPGAVPDPAKTQVLAMRDRSGRVGAYVVWQTADGDQPKGTILQVSVAPALRGRKIGDQLVQLAAQEDSSVKPMTRPATKAPTPPAGTSLQSTGQAAKPARRLDANGLPVIRSRAAADDAPGTSGDFKQDAARIDRLQKAYLRDRVDTTSLFARGGRWSRDREKQQQAIIDHFLSQPGVKKDRQILILGGLPGAGKTTTINSPAGQQALGIDLSEYVTVNADEVKAEMVKRGMIPDYPGLSADEAATLYHAESFEIAHSLMRQAAKRGLNFAYDTSLKTSGQVGFATSAGSRTAPPPWRTTMLFVDVPVAVAKQRARDRYLQGGRYMPMGLIDGMRSMSSRWSSGPSQQFDLVKRQADRWVVVDNSGAQPVVVGSGGKGARRAGGK